MSREVYRYVFDAAVEMVDVETTLLLAIMSVESLHGEAEVRLDASHFLDVEQRRCVVDRSTEVGKDLNRIFVGFLRRELGNQAFRVERVPGSAQTRETSAPISNQV